MWEKVYTITTIMIMVILIILMAYYATVLISKRSNIYFRGKTVKVLERIVLSTNLSITIIQAIDKIYILAVSSKNIELLDVIEYEKWHEYKRAQSLTDQQDLLDIFKRSFFNKKIGNKSPNENPIKNNNDKKGD